MYFEFSVLGFYITTMMFLLNLAITTLSRFNENNKQYLEIPTISVDNNLSKNTINFFAKHNIEKNSKILVSVSGDMSSMSMLTFLYNWYDVPTNIYVLYFNDNTALSNIKAKNLSELCIEKTMVFFDYSLPDHNDILQKDMHKFNKTFFTEGYENLCEKLDTYNIIQCQNMNDTCCNIFHHIFSGTDMTDYNEEFYNLVDFPEVTIYKPYFKVDYDTILSHVDEFNIPFFDYVNKQFNKKHSIIEFTNIIEGYYPYWKENLYHVYRTNVGFDRIVKNRFEDIEKISCHVEKFKNGFVYKCPNEFIPIQFFMKVMKEHMTESNCMDDYIRENFSNNMAKIFFMFNTDDIEVSGSFSDNIYYHYYNNVITVYNRTEIQKYLETIKLSYSECESDSESASESIEEDINILTLKDLFDCNYENLTFNDTNINNHILNNFDV